MVCENEIVDQIEPWCHLNGQIIMVTGASSGLGLEFCLDLARADCKIVAAARRIERLDSLCDQINKMDSLMGGGSCRAVALELDIMAGSSTIEACVDKAWAAFGHIDVLINNAGVRGQVRSSLELSKEQWNDVMNTNLKGSWLVSKYIGTRMRDVGRRGSIINVSSIADVNRVIPLGAVAYASSKVGLNSITKMMALELGKYNIRVNAIAPGLFESEITKDLMQKKWLKNVAKRSCPLGTFGTTNPGLTSLVRYLVHPSSNYVSGNIFIVDSGYTLPGIPIFSSL